MTETGIVAVVGIVGTFLAAVIASVFSPWVQDQFAQRREKRQIQGIEDARLFDPVISALDVLDGTSPIVSSASRDDRDTHLALAQATTMRATSSLEALDAPEEFRAALSAALRLVTVVLGDVEEACRQGYPESEDGRSTWEMPSAKRQR